MDYWHKQTDEPLFPDLLWSRPQTRAGAGKLLIIGGQAQDFAMVAAIYQAAEKAGAGTVRVIMPDSTRKYTGMLPNIEYAPSNNSGSFAKAALGDFFDASEWADHVILAGDLGRNSETTTVLDGYLLRCPSPLTIASDAMSSIFVPREQLLSRPISFVLNQKELQKLGTSLGLATAITTGMGPAKLATLLHEITAEHKASIVAEHEKFLWVASCGSVSSTPIGRTIAQTVLAATVATWSMQNHGKPFEAQTTAAHEIAAAAPR